MRRPGSLKDIAAHIGFIGIGWAAIAVLASIAGVVVSPDWLCGPPVMLFILAGLLFGIGKISEGKSTQG